MGEFDHLPRSVRWRIALYRWLRFRAHTHARLPEWTSVDWFNAGVGCVLIFYFPPAFGSRGWTFTPWNAFRRLYADGSRQWGFGLLQIGGRHLCYQGYTRDEHGRESWATDVGFVHVIQHEAWAR